MRNIRLTSRGRRAAMATLALLVVCSLPARADYDAGKRAWEAGKPAEALTEWRTAAATGDRRAMLALGRLYLQGLGAPQDYVLAHMWFNLSASRGEMAALKERDALTAKMTPSERAEAQKRAREWRPGGGGTGKPKAAAAQQPATTPPRPAAGPPPPRAIQEAQRLLATLGYKPGPADGQWGGRSVSAYGAFLRDAGLPPGDTLTPEGLQAMRTLAKRQRAGTSVEATERAEPQQRAAKPRIRLRPDALHRAARAGDIDGLTAALKAGADVNARDRRGWTALMHAADKGYKLMVEPLLKAKADPNIQAADGATALFMAAVHGHPEIVGLLVKDGADVSIKGPKGKTVVDVAVAHRDPSVRRALVFQDCSDCPEMVVVPGGSYMMGSPADEEERSGDEGPRHRVMVPRPIAVGKYEITFGEWDACVAGGGCGGYRPGDAGWGRGRRPVVNVSWEDAKGYAEWLSRKTGEGYRLLSESEWEYVARGGTRGPFHFGSTITTDQANYDGEDTYGSGRKGVNRGKTVSVGAFPANGFGLHDVHGNVWEWVEDCWHKDYTGAPTDGSAWTSGGDCGSRVLRGGSWFYVPWILRSANRYGLTAGIRNYDNGFRIARTLTP